MALERKPSIEAEPRTLTLAELRYARIREVSEEAMDILNSKTLEDAILSFTEGLKAANSTMRNSMGYLDEEEEEEEDGMVQVQQLCFGGSNMSYPSFGSAKDIATAPF